MLEGNKLSSIVKAAPWPGPLVAGGKGCVCQGDSTASQMPRGRAESREASERRVADVPEDMAPGTGGQLVPAQESSLRSSGVLEFSC